MSEHHPIPNDPRFQDLTNKVFGRLTVRSYAGKIHGRKNAWNCECKCGKFTVVPVGSLNSGTSSCGCLKDEACADRLRTHGLSHLPEYRIFAGMIDRCENEDNKHYKDYGGRGISVCAEWRYSFEKFYAHVGPRPSKKHVIDRIENDGNYEPGNVRWATQIESARNKRNNRWLTIDGVRKTLPEWCEQTGVLSSVVFRRLSDGWLPKDAVFTPGRKHGKGDGKPVVVGIDKLTIDGVTRSISEWCRISGGIKKQALRNRLAAGWTPKDAVFKPFTEFEDRAMPKGSSHHGAVLNEDDVREIRAKYPERKAQGMSYKTIGKIYGVGPMVIYGIIKGKAWALLRNDHLIRNRPT